MFDNDEWLNQHRENVIDPDREIVDPHHHLWPKGNDRGIVYDLDDLWRDTEDGHKVTQTIFMECGAAYRTDGPDHLKPVGETEFVTAAAERSAADPGKATIAALIAHADRGVAHLGERGLTYDTWNYHHQLADFRDLAAAVPGTVMILDHFGTPLGVGPYEGKREANFEKWKDDIVAVATQPNVYAKLGGLAMPDNGFGWDRRDTPPTSDEFVDAQAEYYRHTIECFGPDRCMFESNFPVDRLSISWRTLWNGLKTIAAGYSEYEKDTMFSGTARRVYRVSPPSS